MTAATREDPEERVPPLPAATAATIGRERASAAAEPRELRWRARHRVQHGEVHREEFRYSQNLRLCVTLQENLWPHGLVSHRVEKRRKCLFTDENSQIAKPVKAQEATPSRAYKATPFYSANLVLVLVLAAGFLQPAAACSSRSTPKPRPPSQSAIRPNITFQTYACPPAYAAWYCLNGATCFTVKIADSILYNCECADGYMGQRCEFKDLDGSYLPTRQRLLMLGSSRGGQALGAVILIVLAAAAVSAIYTARRNRGRNQQQQQQNRDSPSFEDIPHCYNRQLASSNGPYNISGQCDVIRGYELPSHFDSSLPYHYQMDHRRLRQQHNLIM